MNPKPVKTLQAMTRTQLADAYGISVRTLRRWFNAHELAFSQRLLTPKELLKIYQVLGEPRF